MEDEILMMSIDFNSLFLFCENIEYRNFTSKHEN